MNLITLSALTLRDIRAIWNLVKTPLQVAEATVAWSFEGNGIRTRTTFIKAFSNLGMTAIELPSLLKSSERICDLAGYLDPFYDMYVIRESNHERLAEFAAASRRPVINAMSKAGHPCEVLTDAYYVEETLVPIEKLKIGLWGPPGNVFRSWHELAKVMGFTIVHICHERFHEHVSNVSFTADVPENLDVLITDGWPEGTAEFNSALTLEILNALGKPILLPTPPFTIGEELAFDPRSYSRFAGYEQKALLLPVQTAVLRYCMQDAAV